MCMYVCILRLSLSAARSARGGAPDTLIPFIIIPCSTGSRLEARLTNKPSAYAWCPRNSDGWFNLYVPQPEEIVPPHVYCVGENLKMFYNETSGVYDNFPGVEVRVPDYGNTTAVEYLTPPDKTPLYHDLINMLVSLGYERGVNLRAAPYDWRLGANGFNASFAQLQALVEETYAINNNTRVVLHSFSLGGPYIHLFLTDFVSQAWKDKYIQRLISISGAFSGSTIAIMASLFERSANLPWYVPKELVTTMIESLGEAYWMLPDSSLFGDEVFLTTPDRNYTTYDFVQMYVDAKRPVPAAMVEAMLPYKSAVTPPGVDIVCVYGYNVSTPVLVVTNTSLTDPKAGYSVINGDGDNCVMRRGLELCDTWAGLQPQPAKSMPIANMQHGDGLYNPLALRLVLQTLGL
eukprot:TRINITY_DN1564_c0_g1_i2.p1 TRINITY_DN1564_c0_g1~~TRINITY_DN1564_c0_g1_i2.p1  ORF type:complete len:405 (-),score=131.04 TRINITY_DN1564_c0_g1_i2:364-1578(-)